MATVTHATKPDAGLLRQLGFVSATALVISNMVGTGIFATTGFMAGDLGSARLILLAWFVGTVFALCGALSYSELGINFPSSGGEYVYLTRAFGPTWGFMTGWVSFFAGFSAPIALAALAFADYVGFFFPAFKQANAQFTLGSGAFSLKFGGAQLLASALIGAFTILNCFGVGRTAKVQNVLTGTKLVVIASFVIFGFAAGSGSWDHFSQTAVRTSTVTVPVQFMTPLEQMKGVLAIGSLAASNLFGPQVAGAFAALMAISITSTVNAMVTIGPRVYYAMAKNRAFFKTAAIVNPKWHTPVAAIVAQGICAMLMTLTPFPQLVIYIGFSLTFFTVMSVASLFIFRRTRGWQRLGPVNFAFPLIPAAYILVGAGMIVYGLIWQPKASLTAAATIALGAAVYHFGLRKNAGAV